MKKPCPYGTHRVIAPVGVLPQAADQLDNTMVCQDNEILIDVHTLNIDSASFTQLKQATDSNPEAMKKMILEIVEKRGKMQNPVTGSGGMLLGVIKQIGKNLKRDLQLGDKIVTLVSLSLTPLKIKKIKEVHLEKDQVDIEGEAILFESGIYAKIPNDLSEHLVLSALDVAGAPAQVAKLVKPNDTVLVLGAAGKSGVLCCYQARKNAGPKGKVIALISNTRKLADLQSLNVCDEIILADARDPMAVYNEVMRVNNQQQVDVTINVVNVPNTEMTSILATKASGIVYFFSMATSFTKAALGAEGIASEALMIIGNGYTPGHAELTLNLLRESKPLYDLFVRRYQAKE
ncbi:MAG TPA: L-erythro-3,5-diaminohexanoate dehydrogenase [Bacilli bacterium]|nr:MAG: L-erythro-3,5-diaminohexanoate dehydrogenase [Tenericutes bacterium ADurb.BinA124]HPX84339.1 L-erythro-3,5-diaminohexanoate dehydrogenase [Bacilli bacterium]HQC74723.1 L-erythro-3,5-diaminohexanoate dehydrogenase [Bacilli bacterium]